MGTAPFRPGPAAWKNPAMTNDLLRRLQAWTEGGLSAAGTQVAVQQFASAPVWFPGARQSPAGGGQPVQRLHLFAGDPGELPTLAVWLSDPAAAAPPFAAPTLQQTGGAVLAFVMNQRFNVVLDHQGERCLLTYDDLLGLRTLMLLGRLDDGAPASPPSPPDVSKLVAPLAAHCAAQPSIRRAWLAVVNSVASTQACVLLDTTQAERHRAALTTLLDPLLPPGVLLTVMDPQDRFSEAIARHDPVYDAEQKAGWVDRVRQRFSRPDVPVIEMDLRG